MSLNYTKTYQSLTQLNGDSNQYGKPAKVPVGKCSAILQNHLQCWRAADVLITTTTTVPADGDKPESTTTNTAQMCYRHAQVDEQQYNQIVNDDKNATDLAAQASKAEAKVAAETPAVKK